MPETDTQPQDGNQTESLSPAPPWGSDDEFNPQKAWDLIQNLRADKEKLAARPSLTDEQQSQLAEYQQIVEASKSDLDKANEQLSRWQTEAETWRKAAVGSRIEALAASEFADPSDAVSALDGKSYLDAGGRIDETAIRADLADVLGRKPHWRKQPEAPAGPRLPAPNGAQGTSGSGSQAPASPAAQFASILESQLNGSR